MSQIQHRPSGQIQTLQAQINQDGIYIPFNQPPQQITQQAPTPVYPAQIQSQQQPQNRNYTFENFMFPIAAILTLFAVCGLFQLNGILSARQTPTINIQPQQPIYQPSPARY